MGDNGPPQRQGSAYMTTFLTAVNRAHSIRSALSMIRSTGQFYHDHGPEDPDLKEGLWSIMMTVDSLNQSLEELVELLGVTDD